MTSRRSARALREDITTLGIRFASVDGDDLWHVDPVPRVIAGARLGDARGRAEPARPRAQRVRRRRLRRAADRRRGRRPAARARQRGGVRARDARPGARRTASGSASPGLDIVRDGDGALARAGGQRAHAERARLLADRARGDARAGSIRPPELRPRSIDGAERRAAAACSAPATRSCSPTGRTTPPTGSTRWLAEQLGLPLAVPADLEVRDGADPPPRRAGSTRSTAARTPTRSTREVGAVAPPGRGGRRAEAGQLLRDRRRRRQARPRLRRTT